MTNIDTPIKELNNKFNKFLEVYSNAYNSLDYDQLSLEELKQYVDEKIDYSLEEWLEEDVVDILNNINLTFLKTNKEDFVKIIDKYFNSAMDLYNFYEFEYTRFGGAINYLYPLNVIWLYLSAIYYEYINDETSAHSSYFLFMLKLLSELELVSRFSENMITEEIMILLDILEPEFKNIDELLFEDWLALNPKLAFVIGNYYLERKKYDSAVKSFEHGSQLNYDGRQSIEPFIEVAKNTYELGLLYLKGLGVKQDVEKAIELFTSSANEIGQAYLPIMGDIYYEGIGVSKDLEMALNCYCDINAYKCGNYVYYNVLNDVQIERIDNILQDKLKNEDLSEYELSEIVEIYREVVNDWDRATEVEELIAEKNK